MIVGFFGFQRSGKSAMSMLLARSLNRQFGIPIYTNMDTFGSCIEIEKLTDIPVNDESKILIWDEIHFSLDSRNISKNMDFTPFISTLGKQKILLFYTCPSPDLVDKRIRRFTSHMVMCRGDDRNIYMQFVDVTKGNVSPLYTRVKNEKLFEFLSYNSNLVIPNMITADISDYIRYVNDRH